MSARAKTVLLFICLLVGSSSAAEPPPEHWSLQPLKVCPLPPVLDEARCQTVIDRFIFSRLEKNHIAPAPLAAKRTLIRRAYFDLIGLPPTPREVQAFIADSSPEAFTRVVDQLLDRPEYGERWARHWLDVVHFAETHGQDQDRPRTNAWPYRDYVIQSFNTDKPYARFVEEQLAGDVLYPADPQATVAMGFLATGPWDESSLRDIREDSIDRQIARYIDRDDIVTTVMNTFVSTTVQCARCHDHKFDPVSQREYYNLQAIFAGTEKGNRTYDPDPALHQKRQALQEQRFALLAPTSSPRAELLGSQSSEKVAAWEQALRAKITPWQRMTAISLVSSNGASLHVEKDLSITSGGKRPDTDTYTVIIPGDVASGVRLEVLADDALPKNGPGRQDNGNFHLSDFKAYVIHSDASVAEIPLVHAQADFSEEKGEVANAIDDDPKSAWSIYPRVGARHEAIFEFASTVVDAEQFQFVLTQNHGTGHLIGRFRLSLTDARPPLRLDPTPAQIAPILEVPPADRSEGQRLDLATFVTRQEIDEQLAQLPPPHWVYAGAHDFQPDAGFTPLGKMRDVRLLKRGDINNPAEPASPGSLQCVPGLKGNFSPNLSEGARRAALAHWITDPRNVLTWRSIVNRVWHYHFGRGIVDSPNDFGRMGGAPSHPELLDWLAQWFLENGGSLKKLHRLIMSSAAYQQSTRDVPSYSAQDADNRLLWRMNRARLDAEQVRDAILSISGTLDRTMGGPSAKQFLLSPGVHVTPVVDYARFDVNRAEMRRRSIYRFIFRTLPDPFMDSLDCPNFSQLTPARNTSVTVSQALAMLNDHFVAKYSEHFADRLERACPGQREAQIRLAIELVFTRAIRPDELPGYSAFVQQQGLINFCRVLFNSNEFMFID